jgi:hypothetical protein
MSRHGLAFLVAPLWVPTLVGLYCHLLLFSRPGQEELVAIAVVLSAVLGYGATLVFGGPAFAFMRARRLTSAWSAAAAGLAIGALTSVVFTLGLSLSLMRDPSLVELLQDAASLFHVASGAMGALVGITLWLIARPDHPIEAAPR